MDWWPFSAVVFCVFFRVPLVHFCVLFILWVSISNNRELFWVLKSLVGLQNLELGSCLIFIEVESTTFRLWSFSVLRVVFRCCVWPILFLVNIQPLLGWRASHLQCWVFLEGDLGTATISDEFWIGSYSPPLVAFFGLSRFPCKLSHGNSRVFNLCI